MKRYAPAVLEAAAAALRSAYWYKKDLQDFLRRVGVPGEFLATVDWDAYKWHIANDTLTRLNNMPQGRPFIDAILAGLVDQDESFPHLRRLREDGEAKARDARDAQRRLRELLNRQSMADRAREARDASRAEATRQAETARRRQELVLDLGRRFAALAMMDSDPQGRGRQFEPLLRDLFAAFDLDPRGSFLAPGEQTDGSIRFNGSIILVEARWERDRSSPRQTREFRAKVQDKLETTLGLYIAMAGFTDEAIRKAAEGRRLVVLMDGTDLAPVFQGVVDLRELLDRKLRHAAETGDVLYRM